MDDIARKRELVLKAYPTESWKTKVRKMPDKQIIAIFLRLKGEKRT